MRRFLLLVFLSCAAAAAAVALMPRQLAGYLALFHQRSSVNSGVVVTALGLLALLVIALRVRLSRSERELDRLRRELAPPVVADYPPAPSAPWEPSAWR